MSETMKKPRIRFKGFTEAWEQRKLNEIADKVTEKNAGLQYIETFTNSAEFGIVSQRDFFDHDIAKMSSLGGYYIVRNEDFVYNPRISTSAPVGPINRNKLGRIGVMSPLYTVFRPHDVDTTYLEYFFKSKYWHSFMNFNGDSGARSDRFSIKDSVFFEMPIPLPYIEEQRKIGEHLTQLDRLITLHQRKYDKLLNIKKSMLEKMFPKNGNDVPEIRFKGFTDAWEQRKLGEVLRLNGRIGFRGYTEKDIVSKDDGGVLTFSPSNIVDNKLTTNCKNTYITRFKYDESPEIKIHNGDILFVKTGSTLGKSALVTGLSEDATLNPQVVVMRANNLNARFLAALLVTKSITSQVNSAKIGGAVPTLTETKIKDFDVAIPVSEAEKEQIGQFFSQLDNLITLHQRKLEKLKNIKKSMLEKMFV